MALKHEMALESYTNFELTLFFTGGAVETLLGPVVL